MRTASWRALLVLGLSAACGCGGTTRNPDDGDGASGGGIGGSGAGTSGTGAGGAAGSPNRSPPAIDGVPIGDCEQPSSEARASAGCPEQPPVDGTACDAVGELKKCPYSIEVDAGEAKQRVHICHPEQLTWGSYDVSCGMVCPDLGPEAIEVPQQQPCMERPLTTCRSSNVLFGFETDQQWLDVAFANAIQACVSNGQYGTRYLLELENGCPARFSSALALPPDVAGCLTTKLGALRWECAVDLSCGRYLVPVPTQSL